MAKTLSQKRQLFLKVESVAYTYLWPSTNPVQADWVPAYDIALPTPSDTQIENPVLLNHYGHLDDIPGQAKGTISFKCALAGNGAGVAPLFGAALKACGLSETIVGATSTTYKPSADLTNYLSKTYSLMVIEDGYGYGISGCQGNVKFTLEAGKQGVAEFSFTGAYVAVAAKTCPALPASFPIGPVFSGAGVSLIPSWSNPEFTVWSLDLGNVITDYVNANSALGSLGYLGTQITGRRITGSVNPLFESSYDAYGAWRAGTTGAVGTGVVGTAGNRYQFTVARAQYNGPSLGERAGFREQTWPFDVKVALNSSDGDDFSLIFT